jgi:hypothetical protein
MLCRLLDPESEILDPRYGIRRMENNPDPESKRNNYCYQCVPGSRGLWLKYESKVLRFYVSALLFFISFYSI